MAGFTLVELLVVIFIISLISGSVLVSSWKSQDQYYASRAAQKMSADFRWVQNMALAGKLQGAATPAGYGVYVQSASQYLIFYNATSDKTYVAGASVILETITPAKTVLAPIGGNVFFVPPDPATYINGVASGSQIFTITSGSSSRSVTVFVGGKIDIN